MDQIIKKKQTNKKPPKFSKIFLHRHMLEKKKIHCYDADKALNQKL